MLIENTLLLREKYPKIRRYLNEYQNNIENDKILVFNSKSGDKTLQYMIEDKSIMIHSKYNPVDEAKRIIASYEGKISSGSHVFFFGVGLGYHIKKFVEMFPNNSYSIYEPITEVFSELANHIDMRKIITANLRGLYMDTHTTESIEYLKEFAVTNKNIQIVMLPSYEAIIEEKIKTFKSRVKKIIFSLRSNFHTGLRFQKLWVINSLINFENILNSPNIFNDIDPSYFKDKPAIIVSAGPSLIDDINNLKHIKENNLAFIFSVGSAINTLIEYDIVPDAICTYDPGKNNHLVFGKLVDRDIKNIPMVFGSTVGYETIKRYKGPKVHFVTTQDQTASYFLGEKNVIQDAPTIAAMTLQLLVKLGANPIFFSGQNLGYLYDRRYSEGIEYSHVNSSVEEDELDRAINITDVFGNQIKSNQKFINMKESIEYFAKQFKDTTFINTTKGGARIEGVPFLPIEKVITEYLYSSIVKDSWWEGQSSYSLSKLKDKYVVLSNSKNDFFNLLSKLDDVLISINKMIRIRDKSKLQHLFLEFDNLFNSIIDNLYFKIFLSSYIRVIVDFIANEIRELNLEKDLYIKAEKLIQIFPGFIENCKNSGSELGKIIDKVLNTIIMDKEL